MSYYNHIMGSRKEYRVPVWGWGLVWLLVAITDLIIIYLFLYNPDVLIAR